MAMAMPSAANQMLVGFRFDPSDQELVCFFLHKLLVKKQPLKPPYNSFIHEYNLFGNNFSPSEIWKTFGSQGQDLYFFCPLKKLTPKRIDRKDGRGGTWSQKDVPQSVMAEGNPNPIGRKRKFRYVNQGSEDHTDWLIDEYSLFSENHCDDTGYDFDSVICRLRKNDRASSKKMSTFSSTKTRATKKMKIEGGSSSTESQITNATDYTSDSTLLGSLCFNVDDMIIEGGSSSTESQITSVTDNTSDSSILLGSPSFNVDDMISDVNELAIPISEVGVDFYSGSNQLSTPISEFCPDGRREEASNVTDNADDSTTLLGSPGFNVDDMISDVELAIPISEAGVDDFFSGSNQLSTPISEFCPDGRTKEASNVTDNVDDSTTLLGNNDSQKFNVHDFVSDIHGGAVEAWNPSNFENVWNQPLDSSYNLFMDDLWAL